LKVKITKIAPYGLFVEVEKDGVILEGLVHISEISWQKVDSLEDIYHEGEEIMVQVLKKEDDRLQFSIKSLKPDPWQEVVKKYPESKEITGHIAKITSFGWLVNLEKGVEGLVHISKLDLKRVEKVEDIVKLGDVIQVKCIGIDDRGRVDLSRKAVLKDIRKKIIIVEFSGYRVIERLGVRKVHASTS